MSETDIKPQDVQSLEKVHQPYQYDLLKQIMLIVVFSALVFFIGRLIEKTFFEKEIIAVDLKMVMTKELEKTATQIFTQEQRDTRAKQFNQALEMALDNVSDNGKKIILVSPAVINGVPDFTNQILKEVDVRLAPVNKEDNK